MANSIELVISPSKQDLPIIKRLKKSLGKGIRLLSPNDIDKAVQLANYLYCLDKQEEASALLDSFIYKVKSLPDRRDVWGANGQGVILRSKIASDCNDEKLRGTLVSVISNDDILSDNVSWHEHYLAMREEHESNMSYAYTETPKYKCAVIAQEALNFLYFLQMLPTYQSKPAEQIYEEINALVIKCYQELLLALTE